MAHRPLIVYTATVHLFLTPATYVALTCILIGLYHYNEQTVYIHIGV